MDGSIPPPSYPKEDFVGSKKILDSPNVEDPPGRVNEGIQCPSIFFDERGEIHNIEVHGKRINLLFSRKGVRRSGDIHENTQHDFIFSGRVEVTTLQKDGGTVAEVYGPFSYLNIPPFVPHTFNFLEDSIIAEWWEPGAFRAWYYTPFRQIVQKSYPTSRPGVLERYGPVGDKWPPWLVKKDGVGVLLTLVGAFSAGLLAGRLIGFHGKAQP